jgi:hypothetical protein
MTLLNKLFLGVTTLTLSGAIQASPVKPDAVVGGQSKSPVDSVLVPGSRLYQEETGKNEFYILGANDPAPVTNSAVNSAPNNPGAMNPNQDALKDTSKNLAGVSSSNAVNPVRQTADVAAMNPNQDALKDTNKRMPTAAPEAASIASGAVINKKTPVLAALNPNHDALKDTSKPAAQSAAAVTASAVTVPAAATVPTPAKVPAMAVLNPNHDTLKDTSKPAAQIVAAVPASVSAANKQSKMQQPAFVAVNRSKKSLKAASSSNIVHKATGKNMRPKSIASLSRQAHKTIHATATGITVIPHSMIHKLGSKKLTSKLMALQNEPRLKTPSHTPAVSKIVVIPHSMVHRDDFRKNVLNVKTAMNKPHQSVSKTMLTRKNHPSQNITRNVAAKKDSQHEELAYNQDDAS